MTKEQIQNEIQETEERLASLREQAAKSEMKPIKNGDVFRDIRGELMLRGHTTNQVTPCMVIKTGHLVAHPANVSREVTENLGPHSEDNKKLKERAAAFCKNLNLWID